MTGQDTLWRPLDGGAILKWRDGSMRAMVDEGTVERGRAQRARTVRLVRDALVAAALCLALEVGAAPRAASGSPALPPLPELPALPARLVARVVAVPDGDTLHARTIPDERRIAIRVAGIDAPEHGQAHADAARAALAALACRRTVTVHARKVDRFGRLVARVEVDGTDLAQAQLAAGHAWFFERYAREQPPGEREAYRRAADRAHERGAGLWRDEDREPPWDYRERARSGRGRALAPSAGARQPPATRAAAAC